MITTTGVQCYAALGVQITNASAMGTVNHLTGASWEGAAAPFR